MFIKEGGRQMDEDILFLLVHSNRIRSKGRKLEHRMFHTNMQMNLFMVLYRKYCKHISVKLQFWEYCTVSLPAVY